MERVNQTLFLWLNAPEHPNALMVALAVFFAQWLIWAIPALISMGWLRGDEGTRKSLLITVAAGVLGLIVNQLIGLSWSHPRPFMIGLGHTLIPHVADSSFPSDHLTLWWTVAFSFILQRSSRSTGVALAWLGLPIAWARIYIGVHFPFDMAGALVVSAFCAWISFYSAGIYLLPIYSLAYRIHRVLFTKWIARGWVRD